MKNLRTRRAHVWVTLWLATTVIFSAGCSTPAPTRTPANTASPLDSPLSVPSIGHSPLPTPVPQSPVEIPTSFPGKGTVKGRLLWPADRGVSLGELFLARALPTSNPDILLPSLNAETAPKAILDRSSGAFTFVNVPPDIYALVIWDPFNSSLINDPETGETLFITVSPDQVNEIGGISLLDE